MDYWAHWCAPCKAIAPIIEELAGLYKGKIKIGKVDVDENSKIATIYGIMSIPTLIFFNKGKVVVQVVGVLSKAALVKKIEENL